MKICAAIASAALLLLAACAAPEGAGIVQPYAPMPAMENVARIRLNESTAEDVLKLIGPPRRFTRLDRQQRDVWIYDVRNAVGTPHILSVQMSADRVVREVITVRHPGLDKP